MKKTKIYFASFVIIDNKKKMWKMTKMYKIQGKLLTFGTIELIISVKTEIS